jgi:hypothetical protein
MVDEAPRIRQRVEAVWGRMFLTQLMRLNGPHLSAQAVMGEVWDGFEELLQENTSKGWLDMRACYLEVTRK